jgi:putative transposase
LSRSTYYRPAAIHESEQNQFLLRRMDEIFTRYPFYGSRRLLAELRREVAFGINRKRVQRLMELLEIAAIQPRRNTSRPAAGHEIYPYLLRGVLIDRVDQVWSSDITYIRVQHGFEYLAAVIDWFSRFVISWQVSNTADSFLCREVLDAALLTAKRPEVFNTDQGSQFTSVRFLEPLKQRQIRISMDGRGRALDNAFIERLWRSVKYEDIYLHDYASPAELRAGLAAYFHFYNFLRPHQALQYRTPAEFYFPRLARKKK